MVREAFEAFEAFPGYFELRWHERKSTLSQHRCIYSWSHGRVSSV